MSVLIKCNIPSNIMICITSGTYVGQSSVLNCAVNTHIDISLQLNGIFPTTNIFVFFFTYFRFIPKPRRKNQQKMTRKKVVDPQDDIDASCKLLCDEALNHMKVRNYQRALNVYNKVNKSYFFDILFLRKFECKMVSNWCLRFD